MGRGGSGNFDSDTAADFAGDLVKGLVAHVTSAIANPSSLEPDEYYGEVVPAIIDIVATLHQLTGTASIPRPEEVAEWRAKFMEAWEAHITGLSPSPQHRARRRIVLQRTFDRLERLALKQFKAQGTRLTSGKVERRTKRSS
jgi:hypothetical protein